MRSWQIFAYRWKNNPRTFQCLLMLSNWLRKQWRKQLGRLQWWPTEKSARKMQITSSPCFIRNIDCPELISNKTAASCFGRRQHNCVLLGEAGQESQLQAGCVSVSRRKLYWSFACQFPSCRFWFFCDCRLKHQLIWSLELSGITWTRWATTRVISSQSAVVLGLIMLQLCQVPLLKTSAFVSPLLGQEQKH